MPVTTTRANPDCTDPKHSGNPSCPAGDPDPPSITYTAQLLGRVFVFGSLPVAPNRKNNTLFPDPELPLEFIRPGGVAVCDQNSNDVTDQAACNWEAVFAACENFFGPYPIYVGPTSIVVSDFTVPAGNWQIVEPGGVRVGLYSSPFDLNGKALRYASNGGIKYLYFQVTLQFIGDTSFDSLNDPFLPGAGETITYNENMFWITGGTGKLVRPRFGCVSGGSAPKTDFAEGFASTLVITATATE